MTILLLVLLVVYFAVVGAPISIRLVGLVLARNGSSQLPLLCGSPTVRPGKVKSGASAAREWPQRDCS
jgi:hypothetical protein